MPFSLKDRSLICAIAAKAVYANGAAVNEQLHQGQSLCQFASVTEYTAHATNSHALIATNDQLVLVAFRGTNPHCLKDILTDARTHLVDNEQGAGRVHKGFQMALHNLMRSEVALFAAIHKAMQHDGKKRQLWLTGHSLGAAVATLAMQLLTKHDFTVANLCTFGAPMVEDRDFAQAFNASFQNQCQRYVHHDDLIPRVPSSESYLLSINALIAEEPRGVYRQVGYEYHIDYANNITVLPATGFEPGTATYLPIPLDSLKDHHMPRYIEAVRSAQTIMPNTGSEALQHSQSLQDNSLTIPLLPAKAATKCCCTVS